MFSLSLLSELVLFFRLLYAAAVVEHDLLFNCPLFIAIITILCFILYQFTHIYR